MKKKNYLNILSMNRFSFSSKLTVALAAAFMLLSFTAVGATKQAQEKVVTGLVRDARTKMPVSAAQITVPNKKISAVADDKGRFTLKLISATDVLRVSAFDYNTTEVSLRGRDSVIIELYSNQFSNFYKSIDGLSGPVNNTALTSPVKSIDETGKSNAITADELIQASLGGDVRSVTRSGTAGIGSVLFIRGLNSLNADAQPLFVVDGVIWNSSNDIVSIHPGYFSNPLDVIDVNDIQSITVVKDGTSIYGSKASNGVILIKTKRARSMVTKIALNVFSGMTTMPGSVPMMSGDEFRVYASDMLNTRADAAKYISQYDFLQNDRSNKYIYNTYHNNTNWASQVYQPGMTNSYVIDANGGDEKAMYYFSLGLTNNKGVVKNTDLQRINSRFNADLKFTDKLIMGLNIGFSRVERSLLDDGVNVSSPAWVSLIKSPFLSPYNYTSAGELTTDYSITDVLGVGNPVALIDPDLTSNMLKKYRFNIGVLPQLKISPSLTLSSQFDYSLYKSIEGRFVPMYYTPVKQIPDLGYSANEVNSQVMRNTGVYDDTRLTYDKRFGANHLKAMLGMRFIHNYYESDYVEEHNTGSNNKKIITGDYKYLSVSGINNLTRSWSNYLNVDYGINNRYFINATVAMDASSRFGKATRGGMQFMGTSWGVFPSANASWVVSSEKFMRNVDFVNFMKVHGGYGITGNDGIKDYEAMAYFSSIRYMDRANGLVIANMENSEIQWETTGRANLGVNLGLFNDRITLGFDYFSGKTTDLLLMKKLPEISGLGMYWSNGGEMSNNGYEMSANLKMINLKRLKWEMGLSAGHYKNKITALPEGSYLTSVYGGEVITAVGMPAGSFYGYKTQGVFATAAQAQASGLKILNADGTYTPFGAGDVIFEDNGDGVIDEKDKQVIGNPNPDFYGAISNKFSFGKFTLNTVFTYSYGNDVYNYFRSQLESGKNFSNQTSAMNTRWTGEGQVTRQPKAAYGDPMGNSRFSDRWIEDGSYLRFKTVSLTYDLPVKNDFIEGISLWVSANNLFTLTNYLGNDPEFSAGNSVYFQGVDAGLVPLTKSYYFGIKLNL